MIDCLEKSLTVQDLIETANALLSIRSTEDRPEELLRIINYIESFFDGFPVFIFRSESNGKPAIVICTRDTMNPAIMLQGHVDVVDGTPDQFVPRLDNGRLYARGSVDMKGFVAVAMHVIASFSLSDSVPDLGLMITTDEEIGGRDGAGRLVEEGWSTELLINGDGGYGDAVSFAEKGIIQVELTIRSSPGQRYAPWNGKPASNLLIEALQKGLSTLCPLESELTVENNWGTTSCILSMDSSSSTPMPPDMAKASVRLYWAGEETDQEILNKVKAAFSPFDVESEIIASPVYLSPHDPRLIRFQSALQNAYGKPIGLKSDNGPSDAKWYGQGNTPILITRFPGDGAHTGEEWLDTNAFNPLLKALCNYIREEFPSLKSSAKNRKNFTQTFYKGDK